MDKFLDFVGKLSSPNAGIRRRAIANLNFKIKQQIVDDDILCTRENMVLIATALQGSVAVPGDELTQENKEYLEEVMVFIATFGGILRRRAMVNDEVIAAYSLLLDKLYDLSTREFMNSAVTLRSKLEEAISVLTKINGPGVGIEAWKSSIITNENEVQAVPSTLHHLYDKTAIDISVLHPSFNQAANQKKAGAIMNSTLVHNGWKFPHFILTESDERYLFDVEVKVKLGHGGVERMIFDVLTDFPVSVIIARSGLIQALLDIIGGAYSNDDIINNPMALYPVTAIRWFEEFIIKLAKGFTSQLDGSLYSSMPNNSNNKDDIDVNNYASQMARAMYAMRHPLLPNENDVARQNEYDEERKNATYTSALVLPQPSFPGVVFAALAASLPLLQTKDVQICNAVVSLFKTALPFIREPALVAGSVDSTVISEIDYGRIQHLLNRMEQLLGTYGRSLPTIDYLTSATSGDDDDEYSRIELYAINTSYVRIFTELVGRIPLHSSVILNNTVTNSTGQNFIIGPNVLAMLKYLSSTSHAILLPADSKVACLSILKKVDGDSFQSLIHADYMIKSVKRLYERLVPSNSSDVNRPMNAIDDLLHLLHDADIAIRFLENDCEIESSNMTKGLTSLIISIIMATCHYNYDDAEGDSQGNVSSQQDMYLSGLSLLYRLVCTSNILARYDFMLTIKHLLLSDDDSNAEMALIKSILPDNIDVSSHVTKACLISPTFLHSLIVHGVLYFSEIEDDNEICYEINVLASDILEILLEFIISNSYVNNTNIHEWASLLPLFNVITWNMNVRGSNNADAGNMSTSTISLFAQELEELCAISSSDECRQKFGTSLVLGLFHAYPGIRARCSLRIQHELLGVSTFTNSIHDTSIKGPVDEYDPFATVIEQHCPSLLPWTDVINVSHDGSTSQNTSGSNVFRHADVRKVAFIAFGEGNSDVTLRTSAIRQLKGMLMNNYLIQTAETSWCVNIASEIGSILNNAITIYGQLNTSFCDVNANGSDTLTLAFLVEIMSLFKLLVVNCPAIRHNVNFDFVDVIDDDSEGSGMTSSVSVKALLVLIVTNVSSKRTLPVSWHIMRLLAMQCMSVIVGDIENFITSSPSFQVNNRVLSAYNDDNVPKNPVFIPTFIARDFACPVPSSKSNFNDYYNENGLFIDNLTVSSMGCCISTIDCVYTRHNIPMPAKDIINDMFKTAVVEEYTARDAMKLLVENLVQLMASSTTHVSITTYLQYAICIGDAVSDDIYVAYNKFNLSHIIRKICQSLRVVSPQEFNSIIYCMKLLRNMVTVGQSSNPTSEWLYSLCGDCYDIINIAGLAESISNRAGVLSTQSNVNNSSNLIFAMQVHVLELLVAVSKVKADDSWIKPVYDDILPLLLVKIVSNELWPSFTRTIAANALNSFIENYNGWEMIKLSKEQVEMGYPAAYLSSSPGDLITRTVKLLRSPDSLVGTGPLTCALRILYLCLYRERIDINASNGSPYRPSLLVTDKDWKWVTRLGYDRRGDVRFLALQIVSEVLYIQYMTGSDTDSVDDLNEVPTASSWPPYDFLSHVMNDSHESGVVRTLAIKIYIENVLYRVDSDNTITELLLGRLIASVIDVININDMRTNVHTLHSAIHCLVLLVGHSEQQAIVASTVLNTFKIMPKLALLLNPTYVTTQLQCYQFNRVNLSVPEEPLLHASDRSHDLVLLQEYSNEYKKNYGENTYNSKCGLQLGVSKLLMHLHRVNCTFNSYLYNSNIFYDLINSVAYMSSDYDSCNVTQVLTVTSRNYALAAACDILSLVIKQDTNKPVSANVSTSKRCNESNINYAVLGTTYAENIVFTMGSKIMQIATDLESTIQYDSHEDVLYSTRIVIISITRLIALILSDSYWRSGLNLGGDIPECATGIPAITCFTSLIALRSLVYRCGAIILQSESVGTCIDLNISLFMQYSYTCREIMSRNNAIELDDGNVIPAHEGLSLVLHAMRTVITIAENIHSSSSTSNNNEVKAALKTLKKKSSGGNWRQKTRSYNVEDATSTVTSGSNTTYTLDAADRLKLFSSLLVLRGALPLCADILDIADDLGLADALSNLIRVCGNWGIQGINRASVITGGQWSPSYPQLAAAVLTCSCAYNYSSSSCKIKLAKAGDFIPTHISHKNSTGYHGTLHQLLSIGLNKSIVPSLRWLSLSLVGNIISNKEYSPSIQKVALTKVLTLAIQKALHAASHDTDALVYLIDAYTACITAESVATPGLKVKALDNNYYSTLTGTKDNGVVMEEMSPPNLVSWIWDSFGSKPEVSAAVIRCLGRMGTPVPIAPTLGGGLSKRLLPNVVAESPMRIMYEATINATNTHPAVEQAVIVALWSILSNSEQARSIFKGMGLAVNMKYADNAYDEGSYVDAALSRGQEALQILLQ